MGTSRLTVFAAAAALLAGPAAAQHATPVLGANRIGHPDDCRLGAFHNQLLSYRFSALDLADSR